METSVGEIHAYPARPAGFEEPLFPTGESRREVAEHLLGAPWLGRASELEGGSGGSARVAREPVELRKVGGRAEISWFSGKRRCARRRLVVRELDRWREVSAWWNEGRSTDRTVHRVLLSCGSVVDLARERGDGWFLVGVVD